jgi:hypothetical protein
MKKDNWWLIGIVAVVILLLSFGGGMMSSGGWGYHGGSMMGGYGMMGNWGYSPMGWFGMGLGMLFMWLIPIGVLALIVYGVAALTRNNGNSTPSSAQTPCPNCAKGVQADWSNCPYCGTALK